MTQPTLPPPDMDLIDTLGEKADPDKPIDLRAPEPDLNETPDTAETVTEDDKAAMDRAVAILARTIQSPLEVAQENAELRSSIKGAYALMHVMVKRLGGVVNVTFDEHSNIPESDGELQVARDPKTGDVSLRLHKANRAERRAAK